MDQLTLSPGFHWNWFLPLGPFLLVGLFLAGLIPVFISRNAILRWLHGDSLKSVARSVAIGVPMPLHRCSVVSVVADDILFALMFWRFRDAGWAVTASLAPESDCTATAQRKHRAGPAMRIAVYHSPAKRHVKDLQPTAGRDEPVFGHDACHPVGRRSCAV